MRTYLELIEAAGEMATETDFIRVDATGWSSIDVSQAIDLLRQQSIVYKHYILQKHYYYHDESKSCTTEIIDAK
jgi:hypothetical protein